MRFWDGHFRGVADLIWNDPFLFSGIRIRDPFPGVLGSGSVSYSNEHNKINWRENLTKYAFWLGPVGPTDKENQVKM
jgi:hypothetical protein